MNDLVKPSTEQKRSLSEEEQGKFNELRDSILSYERQIATHEEVESRNRELAAAQEEVARMQRESTGGPTAAETRTVDAKRAFKTFMRSGLGALSAEERSALQRGEQLRTEERAFDPSQNTYNPADGGILVPTEYSNQVIEEVRTLAPILGLSDTIVTATGAPLKFFTFDDTGNTAVAIDELDEAPQTNISFGELELGAYKYTPGVIPVSNEVRQDAAIDVAEYVRRALTGRIAQKYSELTLTGSGSGEPQGVLTGAGVTIEGPAAISNSLLVDIKTALKSQYRTGSPSDAVRMVFSEATVGEIMKLGLSGEILWQPSMREGEPDRVLGIPYIATDAMADLGAGNDAILYGNFGYYKTRIVRDFTIRRLDEKYALRDAVGFVGFSRMDAKVMKPNAFVKYSVNT